MPNRLLFAARPLLVLGLPLLFHPAANLVAQDTAPSPVTVALVPVSPTKGMSLRWSPKGATVALTKQGDALVGSFPLGPEASRPVAVKLTRSAGATHFDQLRVDVNRDGRFGDDELLTATPSDTRGKWWSTFNTTVAVPLTATSTTRPYPMSLWYVEDPQEPDAAPTLRWSRGGWHLGQVDVGGKPAWVLITEMEMDGIFDQRDSWAMARDSAALLKAEPHGMDTHIWLDSVAYRPTRIDPDGRSITFAVIHPQTTEAEEIAKADIYGPDSIAPRARTPMVFAKDLPSALAEARQTHRRVLIDFNAVWCGPCHVMDRFVFTAADVANAATSVVSVKVDGDDHRDFKKQYKVEGFPTLILLDSNGKELARGVGYQSVVDMVKMLKTP